MKKIKDFIFKSLKKIWEGFLQNLGAVIFFFFASGSYILAINKIKVFQEWVRNIPTDFILTPSIFIFILFITVLMINQKQGQELLKLKKAPPKNEQNSRFSTHCGVWWKIYPDSEYIEDFPYCTCCEPKKKLAQIEWYPNEIFQCPITKAQFRLFGREAPAKKSDILQSLYRAYFSGLAASIEKFFYDELKRIRELHPKITDKELFDQLIKLSPFANIPGQELKKIRERYPQPESAFHFIDRHFSRYKKYFKGKK